VTLILCCIIIIFYTFLNIFKFFKKNFNLKFNLKIKKENYSTFPHEECFLFLITFNTALGLVI
jgi:hypothetical protein